MEPSVKSVMNRYCVTEERKAEFQRAEQMELCNLDSMANIAKLSLYTSKVGTELYFNFRLF